IIEIAKYSGSDAIHPGYGFLAENPEFVKACEENDIVFIGPDSSSMVLMGNKIKAREFIKSIDVPLIEGVTGSKDEIVKNCHKLSFPVLVKAAAGGGGKGMRVVYSKNELKEAVEATAREAKAYFGDGTVFVEKYIENPRHIEFQVLADNFGNAVHLFERECSIQRRYQKMIEEAPSVTLNDETRLKMGEAALTIVKKSGYRSAGTIEFLVDKELNFYFLEMNTRIQVEHPVTEMTTGVDIVEEQILMAAGSKLRLEQKNLKQTGHAIECRIYAEDPTQNFLPSPGAMPYYCEPKGKNIRIDTGVSQNSEIKSRFDPMISKLVVFGENRKDAIAETIKALTDYHIHGIHTNIVYLKTLIQSDQFKKNEISTWFCDENTEKIVDLYSRQKAEISKQEAAIGFLLYSLNNKKNDKNSSNIWSEIGHWRNNSNFSIIIDDKTIKINSFEENQNNCYQINKINSSDENIRVQILNLHNNYISFEYKNSGEPKIVNCHVSESETGYGYVSLQGFSFKAEREDILKRDFDFEQSGDHGQKGNTVSSPMPGKVIKLNVKEGDAVKKDDVLIVVEAMKMENNLLSPKDGFIADIFTEVNEMVDGGKVLITLKEEGRQKKKEKT
ncbi:MAG: biotin/lipoyl-binding protein, partial [Calditrichia bacterium]|nr:biotin/lipoyl-binding protein [Calditrichia bacterium]